MDSVLEKGVLCRDRSGGEHEVSTFECEGRLQQ